MDADTQSGPLSWIPNFVQTLREDTGKLQADIAFARAGKVSEQIEECLVNSLWQKDDETFTKKKNHTNT